MKIIKIQQEEYALLLSENKVQADKIAELEDAIAGLEAAVENYVADATTNSDDLS